MLTDFGISSSKHPSSYIRNCISPAPIHQYFVSSVFPSIGDFRTFIRSCSASGSVFLWTFFGALDSSLNRPYHCFYGCYCIFQPIFTNLWPWPAKTFADFVGSFAPLISIDCIWLRSCSSSVCVSFDFAITHYPVRYVFYAWNDNCTRLCQPFHLKSLPCLVLIYHNLTENVPVFNVSITWQPPYQDTFKYIYRSSIS